jgi:hypothetical protein
MESVAMEFRPDGTLQYWIEQPDGRLQIFNLTYEVSGDVIISNQPSAPLEVRTQFAVGADGGLELNLDGVRSWLERVR